ncbi:MAG: ArsR/SmtB family transcription factor [Alphaproteobacteria bacterium]
MTVTNGHNHTTLITGFDLDAASRMLRSMSNDRRLVILLLLRGKEMSVNDIAERIGLSQSALSQHLAILRSDGLVKTRRQAQSIFYSLASETAMTLLDNVQALFTGTSGHYSDGNVEHVDFRQQSNQSR